MIDHLSFYATDFPATKKFYDATLPTLGYGVVMEMVAEWNPDWPTQRICAYGPPKKPTLWLTEKKERASPRHIAFVAPDRAAVTAFHTAALAASGVDDGAPGPRPMYHPNYYGAFVIDPDGNHVEAVCHRADG